MVLGGYLEYGGERFAVAVNQKPDHVGNLHEEQTLTNHELKHGFKTYAIPPGNDELQLQGRKKISNPLHGAQPQFLQVLPRLGKYLTGRGGKEHTAEVQYEGEQNV